MKPMTAVVADFDRIAAALDAELGERRLTRAERFLVRNVPVHARSALDVGCGDGLLTRALAAHGIATLGVDASPGMIALARHRRGGNPRIDYRVADVMTWVMPGTFDVVLSVSTAHHMALEEIVPRLVRAVAPGGTLLIQDVTTRRGMCGLPMNAMAWCMRRIGRVTGAPAHSKTVAALYDAHGIDEEYLNESCVRAVYRTLLPEARVYLHLEWRYTIVWQR